MSDESNTNWNQPMIKTFCHLTGSPWNPGRDPWESLDPSLETQHSQSDQLTDPVTPELRHQGEEEGEEAVEAASSATSPVQIKDRQTDRQRERIHLPAASFCIHLMNWAHIWGSEQLFTHQFAFSPFLLIKSMMALDGRQAAAGARLQQPRREGAEGRTGAGGQPRIRAVEQPFPVLSFQTVIHRL